MEKNWKLEISAPFSGFAPAWWKNSYPMYGNKKEAADMLNVDNTDPTFLTQGAGISVLTNGSQAAAVTTLIKHILDVPTSSDVTFGIGGNKLYKINSTTVTNDGTFPHTIDKGAVTGEDGECLVRVGDYLYYFYNHSGGLGDIGRLTISTNTFDDDWGSTVPTGAHTILNSVHSAVLAGNGIIYFTNGRYVGYYDTLTNTLSDDELDFDNDTVCVDLVWEKNTLFIVTNNPNISGSNNNRGTIYSWDGVSSSFDEPIIELGGEGGGILTKNGRIYVFYRDRSSSDNKLGYLYGDTIVELTGFDGTLPQFYSKCIYKNQIAFFVDGLLYLYGSSDSKIPVSLINYSSSTYGTSGALAVPFNVPLLASYSGSTYNIVKLSGNTVTANWKSLAFDCSTSIIDRIIFYVEPLSIGARCDWTLTYNRGQSTYIPTSVKNLSYTNLTSALSIEINPKLKCDDFRINLDWSNGSASNLVKIRKIEIEGHEVKDGSQKYA